MRKRPRQEGVVEDSCPWRFVRVHPERGPSLEEMRQVCPEASPVSFLEGFYRLPGAYRLNGCPLYSSGRVAGLDAASGVVVAALGVAPGMNVLDLCCAPGGKMLLCAWDAGPAGSVTGVDISMPRLQLCRRILSKYGAERVRLYCMDGTRGDAPLLAEVRPEDRTTVRDVGWWTRRDVRGRTGRRKKGKGTEAPVDTIHAACVYARPVEMAEGGVVGGYDRVLVDAPCTLDASVRHTVVEGKSGRRPDGTPLTADLHRIQPDLLRAGWAALRVGGVLVYATCSFDRGQNEAVVQHLVDALGNSAAPVDIAPQHPTLPLAPCDTAGCLHARPHAQGTSGMFVACLRKRQ